MIDYLPAVNKSKRLDTDKLEDELISIASGDKSALARFYGDTYNPIYSYVLSFLKNSYDTEDVLHDLYVSVYVNARSYKRGGKPMAWVFAIARNMSLKSSVKESAMPILRTTTGKSSCRRTHFP